jgi:hypothetical protein
MKFKALDAVVVNRDIAEKGLRRGDLGAVVHLHDSEHLEVEFVTASGETGALVSLRIDDLRPVADTDLLSVRPFGRTA